MIKLATTLPEMLAVRQLRNECREFMTGYSGYITFWQQVKWYFTYYRKAVNCRQYCVFLVRDILDNPVGYGALNFVEGGFRVTEGIGEKYRWRGYGTEVLKYMLQIAKTERRAVIADIFADNRVSIALHEKLGFKLVGTKSCQGKGTFIYRHDKYIILL